MKKDSNSNKRFNVKDIIKLLLYILQGKRIVEIICEWVC